MAIGGEEFAGQVNPHGAMGAAGQSHIRDDGHPFPALVANLQVRRNHLQLMVRFQGAGGVRIRPENPTVQPQADGRIRGHLAEIEGEGVQIRHAQNAVAREAGGVAAILFQEQGQHVAALVVYGRHRERNWRRPRRQS